MLPKELSKSALNGIKWNSDAIIQMFGDERIPIVAWYRVLQIGFEAITIYNLQRYIY